jgi:hypothetical protein
MSKEMESIKRKQINSWSKKYITYEIKKIPWKGLTLD